MSRKSSTGQLEGTLIMPSSWPWRMKGGSLWRAEMVVSIWLARLEWVSVRGVLLGLVGGV